MSYFGIALQGAMGPTLVLKLRNFSACPIFGGSFSWIFTRES